MVLLALAPSPQCSPFKQFILSSINSGYGQRPGAICLPGLTSDEGFRILAAAGNISHRRQCSLPITCFLKQQLCYFVRDLPLHHDSYLKGYAGTTQRWVSLFTLKHHDWHISLEPHAARRDGTASSARQSTSLVHQYFVMTK